MELKKLSTFASPKKLGAYLAKRSEKSHAESHGDHGGSVRSFTHAGHKVKITTIYEIAIDGKPFNGTLGVGENGQVHCHSLPNYQTASAVDMVKYLIDIFPDDFTKKKRAAKNPVKKNPVNKPSVKKPSVKKTGAPKS